MFGAEKGKAGKLDGKGLYIGIVQARWNESITNALAKACREELLA
ncbi:MAG TPA: 6,7-dimethyl-8-ribityllumazine synthase, partial [Ramlibacter sp.]|nr:6,7-dimethyl-8-ribityllumazine synthase [Ramlibacter sp.]